MISPRSLQVATGGAVVKQHQLQEGDFKIHFLKRRLARVKTDLLKDYWHDKIDLQGVSSQTRIIEKIVENYQIKKQNNDFLTIFKDFVRDFVLAGGEADYLIDVDSPLEILNWIKEWQHGKFTGEKYNFISHTFLTLNPKTMEVDGEEISFPSIVVFLIGARQTEATVLNELETINYHPTVEFEIIIRENLRIVEIRGPYSLARDFVATAITDTENPLSAARNYFIGSRDDAKKVRPVGPVRQVVKIDVLKSMLNGTYTKLQANFPGTKASKFEVELKNMTSVEEEADTNAKAILAKMVKEPIKGSISFVFGKKEYSFQITKTGGLFLKRYLPESVITYILGKIKISSMK